ncbi:hypothetical protein SLEP1_g37063 [Rubroshorea leprosula]|uniref:Uncharacterized protein n=1 Tax=Rubroshorea leprosula TaxID=152421 RepID=A0AAV5KU61_9ROSI|nr:hypothetical protein SLEP1_g37063 [Rubroshorea leprosula]
MRVATRFVSPVKLHHVNYKPRLRSCYKELELLCLSFSV